MIVLQIVLKLESAPPLLNFGKIDSLSPGYSVADSTEVGSRRMILQRRNLSACAVSSLQRRGLHQSILLKLLDYYYSLIF